MMQSLLDQNPETLTTPQLVMVIAKLNGHYRTGKPLISDQSFDQHYLAELKRRSPSHPYLSMVQPEPIIIASGVASKGRIIHPRKMLSTNKAYELHEVQHWLSKCLDAARSRGIDPDSLLFKATPKLDGIACRAQNVPDFMAVSRGDGLAGNDLTAVFERGVTYIGNVDNDRTDVVGELIMPQCYFDDNNLSDHFEHPRNLIAGLASADSPNPHALQAHKDGGVHFVIFDDIKAPVYTAKSLIDDFEQIEQKVLAAGMLPYRYPLDGIVLEVADNNLLNEMGNNGHFWHGQLAKKTIGETADVTVTGIRWQIGRSGRVSPVVELEPTRLSGCTITNVTAHHARNVLTQGLGVGAVVRLVRSGMIIPKILSTSKPVEAVLPDACPCCSEVLVWSGDFLCCPNNAGCSAQAGSQLIHFSKSIMMDLIGEKTANKLVDAGVNSIPALLNLDADILREIGFGVGQSANIIAEIQRVKSEPIQDYLVLAGLGISKLGRGAGEKLLAVHHFNQLQGLTVGDLIKIDGFAEKSAKKIIQQLHDKGDVLAFLQSFGFNMLHSSASVATALPLPEDSPLAGLKLVFSGKMIQGNRDEMKRVAKAHGAKVQSAVGKNTDFLICGEKVGAVKMNAARDSGVQVLSEDQYFQKFF